jgi:hypothetical protein
MPRTITPDILYPAARQLITASVTFRGPLLHRGALDNCLVHRGAFPHRWTLGDLLHLVLEGMRDTRDRQGALRDCFTPLAWATGTTAEAAAGAAASGCPAAPAPSSSSDIDQGI